MPQKSPENNFQRIENTQFNEDFIKEYNEENDEVYFPETDVQYLEKLHKSHNDLPFLTERMVIVKVEKLVANLHDKTEYAVRTRNLKQALNNGLILKKSS